VGTNAAGKAKLGNGEAGVEVDSGAAGNTIGGTTAGSGNSIAFNAEGVVIGNSTSDAETAGNSILGNSIWDNTGLGIDLGNSGQPLSNGINPRSMPNGGLNTPIITAQTANSVSGQLTSVPETKFLIEFFATPVDGTPNQGQFFLGSYRVTTNSNGLVTFKAPVAAIPRGMVITATATDLTTGDTSEFSPVGT
jgi:titin